MTANEKLIADAIRTANARYANDPHARAALAWLTVELCVRLSAQERSQGQRAFVQACEDRR